MKIKLWGVRGSLPTPLRPDLIRDKVRHAILNLPPDIRPYDPDDVDAYLDSLPALRVGTAGGNTTCVEIQTGGQTFIIDAGSGLRELGVQLMNGPLGRGEGVLHFFFTHAHWDHVQGFPFFLPAYIPGNQLIIHSIHDIEAALKGQQESLYFPVPLSVLEADLRFVRHQPGEVFDVAGLQVRTMQTFHPGKAYAYRFEDNYGAFVFASDAEYKDLSPETQQPFLDFFHQADLLVFDAQYTLRESFQKMDWGHSSALIGVDMARRAGVKRLLLFHHDPSYSDTDLLQIYEQAVSYQAQNDTLPNCEIIVAQEGQVFDLTPPGMIERHSSEANEEVTLTPISDFDTDRVESLQSELARFAQEGWPERLVIDLSHAESLSIAGLKVLIALRAEQPETAVALAGVKPQVQQVIDLAGFSDYFAIYPTVAAANAALQAAETLGMTGRLVKDRYRLDDRVESTWLGTVFKATDILHQRPVTVTVMSPSFGTKAIQRLLRYAERLIGLDHPNLVQMLDVYENEDRAYIVEAWVDSPTLAQRLAADEPISMETARQISLGALSALEYVHNLGLIHYNLNPDAIFVGDTVKLGRFGVSALIDHSLRYAGKLVLLQAAYLAPEQISGSMPDARTDLYSLGVMMYQLFTGQLPFIGPEDVLIEAHQQTQPPAPRELNPTLSRALEHLILKLLSKAPASRYATAHQTRQVLSNLVVQDDTLMGVAALVPANATPFVGRNEVLERLQTLWQTVRQTGQPHLLVVDGEIGIGKTRLVAEFLRTLSTEVNQTVLMGHSNEFGIPYAPYAEILNQILRDALVDAQLLVTEAQHLARQIPDLAPALTVHDPSVTTSLAANPQRAQWSFFQATARILADLGPTILFLDDAMYLDEASIALTRFLLRRTHLPLLVIAAAEIGEGTENRLKSLQARRQENITLQPLNTDELSRYLGYLVPDHIGDSAIATIQRRSHGNPYFAEAIVEYLLERGRLTRDESGYWQYNAVDDSGELPPKLLEFFAYKVEALSENKLLENLTSESREALTVAAVIGAEFDYETWLQLLGGRSAEVVALDALDEALGLQLLSQKEGERYTFNPVDLVDVLTATLSLEERRDLHQQVAELMSQNQHHPALISHHYQEAGLLHEAATYLERAGRRAMGAHALNEAIDYYQQAVTLAETQSGYEALGNLYRQQGDALSSLQALEKALVLAGQSGDLLARARILNSLALVSWMYDRYKSAYRYASRVLSLEGVPEMQVATARSHLGMISWAVGHLEEAETWCQSSLDILNQEYDQDALAGVFNRLGLVYFSQGRFAEAIDLFNRALELRQESDDQWGQAYALNNLGKVAIETGDFDLAGVYLQQAETLFDEIDSHDGLTVVYTNQGRLLLRQNENMQALPILLKAFRQVRNLDRPSAYVLGDIYLLIAEVSLERGDLNRARPAAEEALDLAESVGNQTHIASAQALLARLNMLRGLIEEAEDAFKTALNLFETGGDKVGLLRTQWHWSRFLGAQGRKDEAAAVQAQVYTEAAEIGLVF